MERYSVKLLKPIIKEYIDNHVYISIASVGWWLQHKHNIKVTQTMVGHVLYHFYQEDKIEHFNKHTYKRKGGE